MPSTRGSGWKVLDRRLADDPKDHLPGYSADLSTVHRLIPEAPRSPRAGMRLGSERAKHPKEYAELKAKAQGQGTLDRPRCRVWAVSPSRAGTRG